VPVRVGAE